MRKIVRTDLPFYTDASVSHRYSTSTSGYTRYAPKVLSCGPSDISRVAFVTKNVSKSYQFSVGKCSVDYDRLLRSYNIRATNTMSSCHYIVLSHSPLRFEPVGRSNSVFFDEANKEVSKPYTPFDDSHMTQTYFSIQVFSVRSGNNEVLVRSLDPRRNATIRYVHRVCCCNAWA